MNVTYKSNGTRYSLIVSPRSLREQEAHNVEFVKHADKSLWTSRQKREMDRSTYLVDKK
jgi:hypothetical protein